MCCRTDTIPSQTNFTLWPLNTTSPLWTTSWHQSQQYRHSRRSFNSSRTLVHQSFSQKSTITSFITPLIFCYVMPLTWACSVPSTSGSWTTPKTTCSTPLLAIPWPGLTVSFHSRNSMPTSTYQISRSRLLICGLQTTRLLWTFHLMTLNHPFPSMAHWISIFWMPSYFIAQLYIW